MSDGLIRQAAERALAIRIEGGPAVSLRAFHDGVILSAAGCDAVLAGWDELARLSDHVDTLAEQAWEVGEKNTM